MQISKNIIQTIVLATASGIFASWYVLDNQASRDFPEISAVESRITAINNDIASLDEREELQKLTSSWEVAELISQQSGVELTPMKDGEATHITMDQLPGGTPWYGKLVGTATNVAMAAKRLQKQLPVIFGRGEVGGEQMALSFVLLGTTDN